MHYENFDLLLESKGDAFAARVIASPGGEAFELFDLGISDLELENFLLRIGRPRRTTRRINSPELTAAKNLGSRIYSSVFSNTIRECFLRSVQITRERDRGLRVRIRLRDVPQLHDVPWEFLYDSQRNRFLALSAHTPLVRYLDLANPVGPLVVAPPLQMLVIISSPSGTSPLNVEREWTDLNEALGELISNKLLIIQRLEKATLSSLHRELHRRRYHILHFIGHGAFNARTDSGELLFEDEKGREAAITAEQFSEIVTDHDSLRLVLLNACEGARTSKTDPFSGTAQTLVLQGIPAVIAMQWEITDEGAISFASEFYSAVASGLPVDRSLSYARKGLYARGSEIEWATPVLYLRSPDGIVFDVEATNSAELAKVDDIKYRVDREARDSVDDSILGSYEGAARQAEKKRQTEEAARLAEERRQAEEAARLAEERRQAEEAARLAEERRNTDEPARLTQKKLPFEGEVSLEANGQMTAGSPIRAGGQTNKSGALLLGLAGAIILGALIYYTSERYLKITGHDFSDVYASVPLAKGLRVADPNMFSVRKGINDMKGPMEFGQVQGLCIAQDVPAGRRISPGPTFQPALLQNLERPQIRRTH